MNKFNIPIYWIPTFLSLFILSNPYWKQRANTDNISV